MHFVMRPIPPKRHHQSGFTLVEAIMVIVLLGMIVGMVSMYMVPAVTSYVDSARRTEMANIADTALRRIGRDLRLAVPNTIRVSTVGSVTYLELLLAKTGGRYDETLAANCFASTCSSITTMGSVVETVAATVGVPAGPGTGRYLVATFVPASDRMIIYNQYNNAGNDCSATNPSAYCIASGFDNTSLLSAVPTDNADLDVFTFAAKQFVPAGGSPTSRFQIIDGPVTYACDTTSGTLTRYAGYTIAAAQPTPPAGGTSNLLATNVSAPCTFTYSQGVFQRWGVLGLSLGITISGETVNLYHEVHVNNTP